MTTEEILSQFRRNHFAVISFVERCPADRWQALLPDGERSVAAVTMHIGRGYDLQREAIEQLAAGQPPPKSLDRLHETNSANAQRDANASKAQVNALLNAAAFRMELALGRLTPEQLATPITLRGGERPPLEVIVQETVLDHPNAHLEELQAVAGRL